ARGGGACGEAGPGGAGSARWRDIAAAPPARRQHALPTEREAAVGAPGRPELDLVLARRGGGERAQELVALRIQVQRGDGASWLGDLRSHVRARGERDAGRTEGGAQADCGARREAALVR